FMLRPPLASSLFPYTTLFRSVCLLGWGCKTLADHDWDKAPDSISDGLIFEVVDIRCRVLKRLCQSHDRVDMSIEHSFRFIACQVDRKSTRLNSSHLGISYAVF